MNPTAANPAAASGPQAAQLLTTPRPDPACPHSGHDFLLLCASLEVTPEPLPAPPAAPAPPPPVSAPATPPAPSELSSDPVNFADSESMFWRPTDWPRGRE